MQHIIDQHLDFDIMSKLFTESGEAKAAAGGGGAGLGASPGGDASARQVRIGEDAVPPWGVRRAVSRVPRPYDPVAAKLQQVKVYATSNARMSSEQAGEAIQKLFIHAGMMRVEDSGVLTPVEKAGRMESYLTGIWYSHVMNSSSQLVAKRGEIFVEGRVEPLNYHTDVVAVLGQDARRFFRAVADEVAIAVKTLLDKPEPVLNAHELDMVDAIEAVAFERGLQRLPHFAFDAADACTGKLLAYADRAAVASAKAAYLANSANAVDQAYVTPVLEAQAAGGGAGGVGGGTGGRRGGAGGVGSAISPPVSGGFSV